MPKKPPQPPHDTEQLPTASTEQPPSTVLEPMPPQKPERANSKGGKKSPKNIEVSFARGRNKQNKPTKHPKGCATQTSSNSLPSICHASPSSPLQMAAQHSTTHRRWYGLTQCAHTAVHRHFRRGAMKLCADYRQNKPNKPSAKISKSLSHGGGTNTNAQNTST